MTSTARDQTVLEAVSNYYSRKLEEHGATPRGVDWSSESSQLTRFDQLLKLVAQETGARVADVGCGYGALRRYMRQRNLHNPFIETDISETMITEARRQAHDDPNATFEVGVQPRAPADFALASGIFNVKMETPTDVWASYVEEMIAVLAAVGRRGFAFNCLTSHSDEDRKRRDLFYGNPAYYLDYCLTRYSRQCSLLHDYGLFEFTVIVRKA